MSLISKDFLTCNSRHIAFYSTQGVRTLLNLCNCWLHPYQLPTQAWGPSFTICLLLYQHYLQRPLASPIFHTQFYLYPPSPWHPIKLSQLSSSLWLLQELNFPQVMSLGAQSPVQTVMATMIYMVSLSNIWAFQVKKKNR